MLKEEKELRKLVGSFGVNATAKRYIYGRIIALVRAVREDCANICFGFTVRNCDTQKWEPELPAKIAAAIRAAILAARGGK